MAHYMTYPERIRLETLLGEKRSISYIARKLGFSRQTIYNEIRREPICIPATIGRRNATPPRKHSRSQSTTRQPRAGP